MIGGGDCHYIFWKFGQYRKGLLGYIFLINRNLKVLLKDQDRFRFNKIQKTHSLLYRKRYNGFLNIGTNPLFHCVGFGFKIKSSKGKNVCIIIRLNFSPLQKEDVNLCLFY